MRLGTYRSYEVGDSTPLGRLRELAQYRHLLANFVASDLRSRYRRSYLGIVWAVLYPLVFSAIIALVAIRVFQQPAETYVVYLITGFVVWELIGTAISAGTMSFLVGEGYMRQYRLPYLIYPLRTVSSLAVNSVFSSIAAVGAIIVLMPQNVSLYWLYWPLVMFILYLFAVPLAILAGLANVRFRDFQHAAGLGVFLLWYLSPTIVIREVYDSPGLKTFTDLNPFASALDIFRAVMTERAHPTLHDVALLLGATLVMWILAMLALKIEGRKLIFYL